MDIYSPFGNLLDNAINSVLNLAPDMRCISLNVKAHGHLLSIHSQNCYSGDVLIRDGRPVTAGDRRMQTRVVPSGKLWCAIPWTAGRMQNEKCRNASVHSGLLDTLQSAASRIFSAAAMASLSQG